MGNKEIAVDYRRAANKQKQIKILAELNQCSERKIAEILVEEGEELPKKWQEQLLKPARRSWKFPEEPAEQSEERSQNEPETAGTAPMTAEVTPAPVPEETLTVTLDPNAWDRAVERKIEPGEISAETLLRAACRLMAGAMYLEPPAFHRYSAGVLDLVHALIAEV
jgi:hypothetical protein